MYKASYTKQYKIKGLFQKSEYVQNIQKQASALKSPQQWEWWNLKQHILKDNWYVPIFVQTACKQELFTKITLQI